MFIKKQAPRPHAPGEPILHENHKRPVSRRDFLAAGLTSAPAIAIAPAWVAALLQSQRANAGGAIPLANDISTLAAQNQCNASSIGTGLVPFICIDLAGGANLVGSEVIVGTQGGQANFLSTAAYGKMGLPGNMVPAVSSTFVSNALGLLWHSDGAILRGILSVATTPATAAGTNGAVFCAMSQNDTSTNQHNPMYGIAMAASYAYANHLAPSDKGQLLNTIGSESSVSGGNSMAPQYMVSLHPEFQPATIQQPADATSLVPTSGGNVSPTDVAVMEAQVRISSGTQSYQGSSNAFGGAFANAQTYVAQTDPGGTHDATLKEQLRCAYVQSTNTAAVFNNPAVLDPMQDTLITGGTPIFTQQQMQQDSDIAKTATIMKLVIGGFASAGTITMGGYDYHDSTRATGETRNFKAGQMIGAILEYAQRMKKPVMIYVISDGSLTSSSMVDTSTAGRNKLAWQGDNESVSSTFFLVYNPAGTRAPLRNGAAGQQIGWFTPDGSVDPTSSPAANSIVQIAELAILNWMGLHSKLDGQFSAVFPAQGLGSPSAQAGMTAFAPFA